MVNIKVVYNLMPRRRDNMLFCLIQNFLLQNQAFSYYYTHDQDLIIIQLILIMNNQQTYIKAQNFLRDIRSKIDNLRKKKGEHNVLSILMQINEKIKSQHIGVIILLHNQQYLLGLIQELNKFYGQNKDKQKELIKQVQIIYAFGHSCFFNYQNGYKKLFFQFQNKISKNNIEKILEKYLQEMNRYNLMSKLLKDFFELEKFDGQHFQKGKRLNQYVERFKLEIPKSVYEETIFTYLRIRIQILQNLIMKKIQSSKQYGFCCRLHFLENSSENGIQTYGQNFHRYADLKKFKQKQDIPISKQLVSYLNSFGGICYLGIEISPTKTATIHGVPIDIDQSQRKIILNKLLQTIIIKIFPDDNENDEQDDQQQQERLKAFLTSKKTQLENSSFQKSKYNYDITKYIFIDFINLYNAQTWFYSRQGNNILFVIRIKVKKGNQYQVYHYINQNQIPKAYYREDKKQKQLSMIEYYEQIYRKLRNKAEKKLQYQKITQFHPLCRFKIKLQEEKK